MAEILYQGHGSFRLTTSEGSVIYIDPYAGEGYDRPADLVLVSHEHHDHNAVELVKRKEDGKILRAGDVLKDGVYQEIRACGVKTREHRPTTKITLRISAWVLWWRWKERRFTSPAIPPDGGYGAGTVWRTAGLRIPAH